MYIYIHIYCIYVLNYINVYIYIHYIFKLYILNYIVNKYSISNTLNIQYI